MWSEKPLGSERLLCFPGFYMVSQVSSWYTFTMDVQRIMVVDDDPVTLTLVRHVLENADYEVSTAVSGEDALNLIKLKGVPHLAIVDINMPPGMNGFQFCKEVHKLSPGLPTIMLTGDGDEATVVRAFDEYEAEDYLVKPKGQPIRAEELVSRVRRVLRNRRDFTYTRLEPITSVDDYLQVNFEQRKAIIEGKKVSLTPIESKLLAIFIRYAGRTLTNDYLLRHVWPMEEAYEERLHTHVYRLRKKIERNPKEPYYILSKWGTGYNFLAIP